jgi:hypothetical protein
MAYNLPGVELTIKDGNLVLPMEPSGTQRVLIIAPRTDAGEALPATISIRPQRVKGSEDFATYGLGVYSETNPLAKKWKQAYDAGCREVYLLPLYGATAAEKYEYLHEIYSVLTDFPVDILLLGGVFADDEIVQADVMHVNGVEDFIAVGMEPGDFVAQTPVTIDAAGTTATLDGAVLQSSIVVTVDASQVEFTFDHETNTVTLAEAVPELTTAEVTYSSLPYDFAYQIAAFCKHVTARNDQVIGVMSAGHPAGTDLSSIKTYIDGLGEAVYNQFLQVVAGPNMLFEIANKPYEDDFSGAYAGLISILPSYSSPTNKVIPGVVMQTFKLSASQIQALTEKNYVVPRTRNGRVVVSDAVTTAPDTSDFVRLSTVRIVNDAVNLVREICDPYIGEPNTLPRRNALQTQIDTALKGMIRRGALNDYRFSVKASLADQMDGNIRIILDLVPVFETRRIFVTVALKPSL